MLLLTCCHSWSRLSPIKWGWADGRQNIEPLGTAVLCPACTVWHQASLLAAVPLPNVWSNIHSSPLPEKKSTDIIERSTVFSLRSLPKTLFQLCHQWHTVAFVTKFYFSQVALLAAVRDQCFWGGKTGKKLLVEWNLLKNKKIKRKRHYQSRGAFRTCYGSLPLM